MIEKQRKEIGIRKVLGASVQGIMVLVSKKFLLLILLGFLVATPVSFYFMDQWLDGFAYRIDVGPGVYMLALVISLLLAGGTISFNAVRAAFTNPANILREE